MVTSVASPGRTRAGILAGVASLSEHPATRRVREAAERKGVQLDVRTFADSTHTAADAAAAIGCELGQIVKSVVFVAPRDDARGPEPFVCLVSGTNRVDLARLAAVLGEPDVRRASAREANDATGFVIGGIPPFAYDRPIRAIMDPDLARYPVVWAAAGTPTAVLGVPPAVLRTLANAEVAPIGPVSPDTPATARPGVPA
jgi:prolyl-tRNA editing enzyme YbaK/EbsC (Cys-tRNA(Pro) deacylase)